MSEQSLEDLLNDVEEPAVTEESETTETETETVDTETKETEQSETEETEEASTTEAKKDEEEPQWTKAAALDERRKRQDAERRNAELEQRIKDLESGTQKRPDVFEDQNAFVDHLKQEFHGEIQATRLEISQELMREKFENYDVLEAEFVEMAKDNPVLLQQLQQARNPAKFAAETALKARQARELQDVDKMRAEIRAKLEAEEREKLQKQAEEAAAKGAQKRAAVTPSLAATQSTGGVDDFQDESLEAIFDK